MLEEHSKPVPERRVSLYGGQNISKDPTTQISQKQMKNIEHDLMIVLNQILTEKMKPSSRVKNVVNESNMLIGFIRTKSRLYALSIANRSNIANAARYCNNLKGHFQSGSNPKEGNGRCLRR